MNQYALIFHRGRALALAGKFSMHVDPYLSQA
jgi:hypothetical protein